ncbi:ribonuclease P protein subunit [archaeon]|mgnify:FL=1|jgi:ribonuclease P protein subunit POP4|nr:ribonuclease P protein subunit [archaeon]MBT4416747.1 ribonuclease P protein subunit [archaeon]
MVTPKNLIRHELIGLEVEVVKGNNLNQVGIKGKIVEETRNTLIMSTDKGEKKLLKKDVTLKIKLNNKLVEMDGERLVGKPEERIKKWK